VKEMLGAAFARGTLGHAYLFCGGEGVGTFQAAAELATALLCTGSGTDAPCGECDSCRKAAHNAHPDLGIVLPVALRKEHRGGGSLSQEGWEYLSQSVQQRLAAPYETPPADALRTIPVEWIREVTHAVLRGAVAGRHHVAIMCGVELMNKESANAMLKTLEEPPLGSVMLLCTESPLDVLPTIRSRCQVVRFGRLPDDDIREGLRRTGVPALDDEAMRAVVSGAQGSLGAAIELAREPHPEALTQARTLWDLAGRTDLTGFADGVERLAEGLDAGSAERLLIYCTHIVRERLVAGVTGAASVDAGRAERLLALCGRAVHAVRARGIIPLALLDFVYEAREILDGQEQQPG